MKSSMRPYAAVIALAALFAGVTWTATQTAGTKSTLNQIASAFQSESNYTRSELERAEIERVYAERVFTLPEDGAAWHTTVITNAQPTAEEQQILSWFDTEQPLVALKSQTHWHHVTPESKLYGRMAPVVQNGLPVVLVQDASGKVVYKQSGAAAPKAPWPLIKGIRECIGTHCPHLRPKPKPCPTPEPKPEPVVTPEPSPNDKPAIPDIGPDDKEPEAADASLLLAGLAGGLCLLVGVGLQWRKESSGM